MRFRREIQGLRGLGAAAVLLFHANMPFARSGFVALDVFFVISGFLVFGIVKRELEENSFSLAGFFLKRIQRLYPAFIATLLLLLPLAYWLFHPEDFSDLNRSVRYALGQLANVYYWRNTGYFDTEAQLTPLLHFWSVSFEWQFYILFPFLVIGLRRLGGNWLRNCLAALCLVGFGMSFGVFRHQMTAYYLLPFRGWEMLLGALAVYVDPGRMRQRWIDAGYAAGILLLAVPFATYGHGDLAAMAYPGPAALPPCLGTVCLILFHERTGLRCKRILEWAPLVRLGEVSYSVYLVHWPALVLVRYYRLAVMEPVTTAVEAAAMAAAAALGVALYYGVEKPCRNLRLSGRWSLAGAVVASVALLVAYKATSEHGKDLMFKDPALIRDQGTFKDKYWYLADSDGRTFRAQKLGDYPDDPERVDLLILGDSQAGMWSRTLDRLCGGRGVAGLMVGGGSFLFGLYRDIDATRDEALVAQDALQSALARYRIRCAVIANIWGAYAAGESTFSFHPLHGDWKGSDLDLLETGLERTLRVLRDGGVERIFVVLPIPNLKVDPPRSRYLADRLGVAISFADKGPTVAEYRAYTRDVVAMLRRHVPEEDILDAPALLLALGQDNDRFPVEKDGVLLYADMTHFSFTATEALAGMFDPVFEACRAADADTRTTTETP